MQDAGYVLPGTPLPGTWVNKGKTKGRNLRVLGAPASSFPKGGTRQPSRVVQRHHGIKQGVLGASPKRSVLVLDRGGTVWGLPRTPLSRTFVNKAARLWLNRDGRRVRAYREIRPRKRRVIWQQDLLPKAGWGKPCRWRW